MRGGGREENVGRGRGEDQNWKTAASQWISWDQSLARFALLCLSRLRPGVPRMLDAEYEHLPRLPVSSSLSVSIHDLRNDSSFCPSKGIGGSGLSSLSIRAFASVSSAGGASGGGRRCQCSLVLSSMFSFEFWNPHAELFPFSAAGSIFRLYCRFWSCASCRGRLKRGRRQ